MLRFVEVLLRPFDNENREWILRLRLWKTKWFPYRTCIFDSDDDFLSFLDSEEEPEWHWNRPRRWQK